MPRILSEEQVREHDRDGVVFPITALNPGETSYYLGQFQQLSEALGGRLNSIQMRHLHLCHSWAYDLATHPRVLDAVEDVLGPNILLHSTTMFSKYPRDGTFVSWHQDGYYIGLSSLRFTSAWIALSDSSLDNGCIRVVRGSHREGMVDHTSNAKSPYNLLDGLEVSREVDEAQADDVVLAPGEMSFHHVAIVHGSNPNYSDRPRIGFAVRYFAPDVAQRLDHYPVVVARGEDTHGHYRVVTERRTLSLEQGIRAQGELSRWVQMSRASAQPVPLPTDIGLRWKERRNGAPEQ